MSRFTVPPGCESIKMKSDGSIHKANRQGSVVVPDHYDSEIKRSAQALRGYANPGVNIPMHQSDKDSKYCTNPRCRFVAFAWSAKCPRCASPLADQPVPTEHSVQSTDPVSLVA